MKLSSKQLRSLIKEEIGQINSEERTKDEICSAIANNLFNEESFNATINELIVNDENLMRPVRYEDVDAWAYEIAELVREDLQATNTIENIAARVVRSLMEPK
jgi:hypothetical protein